jgi:hypothetical protein
MAGDRPADVPEPRNPARQQALRPVPGPGTDIRYLTSAQTAILAAEVWSTHPAAYTVVSAVRVAGVPTWDGLADAARKTLTRHDIFAWRPAIGLSGEVSATAGPAEGAFTVEQIDLSTTGADPDTAIQHRLHQERHRNIRVLDSGDRPYTRMLLFRTSSSPSGDSGVCALITHHIFIDEHSTGLIWNEVMRRAAGRDVCDAPDLSYARWAYAATAANSQARDRSAAAAVTAKLNSAPLTVFSVPRIPTQITPQPLRRFSIPAPLTDAAAGRARAEQVPVAALYGAAFAHAVCTSTRQPAVGVALPVTRRRDLADITAVGCYVHTVPVLALLAAAARPAIHAWHQALAFAAAHAHADPAATRSALGAMPQVSLFFEARGGRNSAKPITWQPMSPPDSPAKTALSCFLAPGAQHSDGDGRLLWQPGVLDLDTATAFVSLFLDTLTWLSGAEPLPPIPEER